MDSTTDRRFTRTEVRLDEPHFDEEATLLSAQPVVPLEELKAKTRSKARLALALAIGGGLLIGLLAATLIYRYIGSNGPQVLETTAVTEQPAMEQANSAGGATATDETAVTPLEQVTSPPVVTEKTETGPAPVKDDPEPAKPEPNRQSAPKPRPVIIVRDESEREDDEVLDREARRAERQEERRQRRRAAKDARRVPSERAQSDDLLRIREIFEGSPRP